MLSDSRTEDPNYYFNISTKYCFLNIFKKRNTIYGVLCEKHVTKYFVKIYPEQNFYKISSDKIDQLIERFLIPKYLSFFSKIVESSKQNPTMQIQKIKIILDS